MQASFSEDFWVSQTRYVFFSHRLIKIQMQKKISMKIFLVKSSTNRKLLSKTLLNEVIHVLLEKLSFENKRNQTLRLCIIESIWENNLGKRVCKNSCFLSKFFHGRCQNCFLGNRKKTFGKKLIGKFEKLEQNSSRLWVKAFDLVCQGCIQSVRSNLLKKFFRKFNAFFGSWGQDFSTVSKNLSRGLSKKTHSTSPKELFVVQKIVNMFVKK